jgi:hypothetical protein
MIIPGYDTDSFARAVNTIVSAFASGLLLHGTETAVASLLGPRRTAFSPCTKQSLAFDIGIGKAWLAVFHTDIKILLSVFYF